MSLADKQGCRQSFAGEGKGRKNLLSNGAANVPPLLTDCQQNTRHSFRHISSITLRRLTKKKGAAMPPSAEDVCYGAGNRVIEKVPAVTFVVTLFVVSVSTTFDQVTL
jgi:hypothetical protein